MFERQLLGLTSRAGLPRPEVNARVNGHEVDFLWRAERLILECDCWTHHGDRSAFERDRRRDQRHVAHGHRGIRITYRQLAEEPLRVIGLVAQALADTSAAA